jgi:hypothetical protein
MLHKYWRGAGDIEVVLEEHTRVHDVQELNMGTVSAKIHVQGELRLFLGQLGGRDERIGQRSRSQLEDQLDRLALAQSACITVTYQLFRTRRHLYHS